MPITYFILDNPDGDFHIVYQVPGTKTFSSVATTSSESLAEEFVSMLNGKQGNGEVIDHG